MDGFMACPGSKYPPQLPPDKLNETAVDQGPFFMDTANPWFTFNAQGKGL